MVFFLISVSFGKEADPLRKVSTLITSGSSPLQVIYKKFNIPCPLNEEHGNLTLDTVRSAANGTDDFCEAKMFTINSQVWSFYLDVPPCQCVRGRGSLTFGVFGVLDGVHHPYSGLCFCLPS